MLARQPAVEQRPEPSLWELNAGAAGRPFFFLHGDFLAGGEYCAELARLIGPDRPFYALAPHGLAGPHTPGTLKAQAASHLEEIRRVQPEGPYRLGGYDTGGVEALVLARQLLALGQAVELLVSIAPGAVGFYSRKPRAAAPRNAAGRPPYDRRVAAWGAANTVCRNAFPWPAYPGHLTLLQPGGEPAPTEDLSRGWKDFAETVEVHLLPGGHRSVTAAHLRATAETLAGCLRGAVEPSSVRHGADARYRHGAPLDVIDLRAGFGSTSASCTTPWHRRASRPGIS